MTTSPSSPARPLMVETTLALQILTVTMVVVWFPTLVLEAIGFMEARRAQSSAGTRAQSTLYLETFRLRVFLALNTVWNVPMGPGLAPQRYLDALFGAVDAATAHWTPDLVLVSSGFDSMARDPLGGFTLELEDVATLTRGLVERAERWCGGRLVSALEGGYEPARVGAGVIAHLQALQ